MIKRMILMLAVMTLLVGGVIGFKLYGRHMMNVSLASQKPPPAIVATTEARELEWRPSLHAVGSFAATQGIVVSAQLDGAATRIAFEPGAVVEAGQLLVQQDISTETAQLDSAEAAAVLAGIALERAEQLRANGTNAPSDLDAAKAGAQQARAAVATIRSMIEKKTIRAPFAGRTGIRQVNLGQFLRSGAPVVSLQALDPIYFNFTLPQQNAASVQPGQPVTVTVDAWPGATFRGTIGVVNPDVDPATRALQLQAALPNPDGRLQPGMFGAVEVQLPVQERRVTLPLSAIVYNPYGDAVYLVEKAKEGGDLVVRQQFVTTGATRGDQVAILKGVAPGAVVVTAGQLKLRNGATVVVNNAVTPSDAAHPQPDHP